MTGRACLRSDCPGVDPFWRKSVEDFVPELSMTSHGSGVVTGMTETAATPIEHLVPRDADVLRRRILATYDARSKFVHTGSRNINQESAFIAPSGRAAKRTDPSSLSACAAFLSGCCSRKSLIGPLPNPFPIYGSGARRSTRQRTATGWGIPSTWRTAIEPLGLAALSSAPT